MSTPNPLAPQGSLLEQQAKGRSTFHVISFIGAVHVMLLCGILWTACSKDEKTKLETANTVGGADPYASPPIDNNAGLAPIGNTATNTTGLPGGPSAAVTPGYATPPLGTGAGTPPAAPPTLPPSAAPTAPPSAITPADNTTTPAGVGSEYKVVKGDIGEAIAKKHGVSMKSLAAANPDVNWNRLKINQSVKIPAASTLAAVASATTPDLINTSTGLAYTVKAGDTGMRIAAKHGVKWSEIRRANNLKSDALRPGQKLAIPTHTSAGATTGAEGSPAGTVTPLPAAGKLQPTGIPVPRGPGQ